MRHGATTLCLAVILAAAPARADEPRAEMARALEAAAEIEPAGAELPTVSPVVDRPRASSQAAARASAASHGRALAAAFARAVRAASRAVTEHATKARAHGRERPGRGGER